MLHNYVLGISPDSSLNLDNLTAALAPLPAVKWYGAGLCMNVPDSRRDQIWSSFATDEERKTELLKVFLSEHPQPSWNYLSYTFYHLGGGGEYHAVLESIQSVSPTGNSFWNIVAFSVMCRLLCSFYHSCHKALSVYQRLIWVLSPRSYTLVFTPIENVCWSKNEILVFYPCKKLFATAHSPIMPV